MKGPHERAEQPSTRLPDRRRPKGFLAGGPPIPASRPFPSRTLSREADASQAASLRLRAGRRHPAGPPHRPGSGAWTGGFLREPRRAGPAVPGTDLAREGRFSAIALHIGLAGKYFHEYAGDVPLILKLNGKTAIPSDAHSFSPLTGTVEDAVRLGADAVGYTIYVGSPAQDRDLRQFMEVRQDAQRFGMPLIVWAYPRGEAVAKKGGKESLYAIDYAARVALELGADVVKVNYPVRSEKDAESPPPYNTLSLAPFEAFRKVVESAGRTLVLVSGGEKVGDAELLEKVRDSMDAGATGIIFGRNLWQRPRADALRITRELHGIFREYAAPLA